MTTDDNSDGPFPQATPLPNKHHSAVLLSDPAGPFSSSPAFATPLPLLPTRPATNPGVSANRIAALAKNGASNGTTTPSVISVRIDPPALRMLAVRVFKRHSLNIAGAQTLPALANFVGLHCGAGWKDDGLAEGVLDEVARLWKAQRPRDPLVREENGILAGVLKVVAGIMVGGRVKKGAATLSRQPSFMTDEQAPGLLSRQASFGMSSLGLGGEAEEDEDENELLKDPREWLKIVDAFEQPRLVYNTGKRHFERSTKKATLLPPPSHKTELFRQRYHIVHQRILRDPEFDQHPLAGRTGKTGTANKITPISNLLGRTRTRHLLLGLLQVLPTGQLAVSDTSGSIILDMQSARAEPDPEASWFCPGMIVLVEGVYVEEHGNDGSTSEAALGTMGGVGATIGGRFVVSLVAHPPCERRATTLAIKETEDSEQPAEAFGWTDFLGVGSSKATGPRMRKLMSRLLIPQPSVSEKPAMQRYNSTKIAIASEVNLDKPNTLNSLRLLFSHYDSQPIGSTPLAIVLMGNFISAPALAGTSAGSSLAYKEAFNSLASVMSDFPALVARTTWIFVPGDNDAWPSAFSAGGSVPLPRKGVPEMFTGRVGRVVAEANREVRQGKLTGEKAGAKGKQGEVLWASNPARLTWFGVAGEMVLFRDDITGRIRRTAIRFPKQDETALQAGDEVMAGANQVLPRDLDMLEPAAAHTEAIQLDPDLLSSRRLTKTLLDQAHLSPFPLSIRPVHWDHALSCLHLYPLPTSLVVADAEAPAFAILYNGCCVMNPGRVVDGRRGEKCSWIEFDVTTRRGEVRQI